MGKIGGWPLEENEYRSLYHAVNAQRCVFEKSILSRRCNCQQAHRFNLADREGIACRNAEIANLCQAALERMREKAVFALKLTRIEGPLAHAKEIKVQTGGLFGIRLQLGLEQDDNTTIEDISSLLQSAIEKFGDLEKLPYTEIARNIVQFEGRTRRGRR